MPKTDWHVYCSEECKKLAKQQQFNKYPSLEELESKYVELKSWEKVAKHFGITRKIVRGIRKRK
jgi:hypothetical protein